MIYMITATACLISIWAVFYVFIPEVGKLSAIYVAHDARDAIFRVARNTPGLADTHFYRDVEFVCTSVLHVVREGRYGMVLSLATEFNDHAKSKSGASRKARYEAECSVLGATFEQQPVVDHLLAAVKKCECATAIRLITGTPITFVVGIAGMVAALFSITTKAGYKGLYASYMQLIAVLRDSPFPTQRVTVPSIHPEALQESSRVHSGVKVAFCVGRGVQQWEVAA